MVRAKAAADISWGGHAVFLRPAEETMRSSSVFVGYSLFSFRLFVLFCVLMPLLVILFLFFMWFIEKTPQKARLKISKPRDDVHQ